MSPTKDPFRSKASEEHQGRTDAFGELRPPKRARENPKIHFLPCIRIQTPAFVIGKHNDVIGAGGQFNIALAAWLVEDGSTLTLIRANVSHEWATEASYTLSSPLFHVFVLSCAIF